MTSDGEDVESGIKDGSEEDLIADKDDDLKEAAKRKRERRVLKVFIVFVLVASGIIALTWVLFGGKKVHP